MKKHNQIEVLVGYSQEAAGGIEDRAFDTIADAKRFARYALTEEYRASIELSSLANYSAVYVNGECHSDFFRKGYSPITNDEETTGDIESQEAARNEERSY